MDFGEPGVAHDILLRQKHAPWLLLPSSPVGVRHWPRETPHLLCVCLSWKLDFELSDEAAKGAAPSLGIWLRRLSPRVPMGPAQPPCSLLGKAGLTGSERVLGLSAAGASPERPFIKYQDTYGWSHPWTSVSLFVLGATDCRGWM